ncbi:MAG: hypothetical protein M1820_002113 [Bogoriella megaspora]|nr:MAG: hypothetical protein M1820_002113 [Bogoriella megaspora]
MASSVGSRICKAAIARGWDVTSISRSGEPQWASVSSSPNAPPWSKSVSWQRADILKPSSYKSFLEDADAVVHSMGILLEADYKGVISGKEPIYKGLQRAFSSTKAGTQNPLERKGDEDLEPKESDGQLTYEVMNRDSGKQPQTLQLNMHLTSTAITLAQEAAAHNASSFVYISATAGTPILPARYITTKRDAESAIATNFPRMRNIFIRPSFLYDSSRTFTIPIAAGGFVASMINSMTGNRLTWLMGAGGIKPVKADAVGEAVVEALSDDAIKGIVDVPDIEALATKAWRKGML